MKVNDICPRSLLIDYNKEMRWTWWCLVAVVVVIVRVTNSSSSKEDDESLGVVSRIAFGSCANQSAPQPIWNAINKFDPQVFIWLGDNIYGDIRRPLKLFGKERTIGPWKNVPRFVSASPDQMQAKYALAKSIPAYSRLRKNAKVIGTWDDHDYGLNDAGKELAAKSINQRLLLDFLDEPLHSPRRKQVGVYASYSFGPQGRQIKIILLDTRYHRDPLGSDGTILGTSQWTWLEKELKSPSSAITIIASSIQVISNLSAVTGPMFSMESWGRFPKERDRLFKLIADSKRNGVFFISGDVHFGEITRYDCGTGYPLYDITSSGLTQAIEKAVPSPLHFILRFLAWLTPNTMRVMGPNCRFRSCTYGQPNFGVIEIDWDSTPVTLKIEVRDTDGFPVTGVNVSLSELQAQSVNSVDTIKSGKYLRHCSLEVTLPWTVRYRLAILFYFALALLLLVLVGITCAAILFFRLCLRKRKID
ncbi:PhoD domain-containing protein [Cephalotus follicularis]|uniref:PhoD domain-containing protein n=1 Tax=Cephalotus follicularis TaxID=3775 RepID=A0A1Q3BCN2_CEPFO|nr:PhoD domain-containing protein [Cephalotus follicularis]